MTSQFLTVSSESGTSSPSAIHLIVCVHVSLKIQKQFTPRSRQGSCWEERKRTIFSHMRGHWFALSKWKIFFTESKKKIIELLTRPWPTQPSHPITCSHHWRPKERRRNQLSRYPSRYQLLCLRIPEAISLLVRARRWKMPCMVSLPKGRHL